jgi:hypothetical protein
VGDVDFQVISAAENSNKFPKKTRFGVLFQYFTFCRFYVGIVSR